MSERSNKIAAAIGMWIMMLCAAVLLAALVVAAWEDSSRPAYTLFVGMWLGVLWMANGFRKERE